MNEYLTLLMNVVGPLVLGLSIAYLMIRSRRLSRRQQEHTQQATKTLFEKTDQDRERQEEADARHEARARQSRN